MIGERHALNPPIRTPREGGSLGEFSIIFFQESILGKEGKELEELQDTVENVPENFPAHILYTLVLQNVDVFN